MASQVKLSIEKWKYGLIFLASILLGIFGSLNEYGCLVYTKVCITKSLDLLPNYASHTIAFMTIPLVVYSLEQKILKLRI